jgi:hypothetical protein
VTVLVVEGRIVAVVNTVVVTVVVAGVHGALGLKIQDIGHKSRRGMAAMRGY